VSDRPDDPEASSIFTRRRRVLGWLGKGFLSLWGAGFLWAWVSFLKAPLSNHGLTERTLNIGDPDSFVVGQAMLVRHGDKPLIVIRATGDSFIGLSAVCTHLNCVLTWDAAEGILRCPCHDGAFDVNGNVLTGPPPRPLERFRVEVRLGELFLHL